MYRMKIKSLNFHRTIYNTASLRYNIVQNLFNRQIQNYSNQYIPPAIIGNALLGIIIIGGCTFINLLKTRYFPH